MTATDEASDGQRIRDNGVISVGWMWAAALAFVVALFGGSAWLLFGLLVLMVLLGMFIVAGGMKRYRETYGQDYKL